MWEKIFSLLSGGEKPGQYDREVGNYVVAPLAVAAVVFLLVDLVSSGKYDAVEALLAAPIIILGLVIGLKIFYSLILSPVFGGEKEPPWRLWIFIAAAIIVGTILL